MTGLSSSGERSALQRNALALEVSIGDALVLFRPDTGLFCDVNDTGKAIWDMIAIPRTLGGIVMALCERFAVNPGACETEILPFLDTLRKSDFISATGASAI